MRRPPPSYSGVLPGGAFFQQFHDLINNLGQRYTTFHPIHVGLTFQILPNLSSTFIFLLKDIHGIFLCCDSFELSLLYACYLHLERHRAESLEQLYLSLFLVGTFTDRILRLDPSKILLGHFPSHMREVAHLFPVLSKTFLKLIIVSGYPLKSWVSCDSSSKHLIISLSL